jgi:P pilus assembly chaperone PapD
MKCFLVLFLLLFSASAFSQTGLSVSPPRVYFSLYPGQTGKEKISVTNVSKNAVLDLSVSLADWAYDDLGSNVILPADSLKNSFAKWVVVQEGSYFSLKPGETKDLTVLVSLPQGASQETSTALLFISQMNPVDEVDAQGSSIKVSVRSGVKLYLRTLGKKMESKMEITGFTFDKEEHCLWLEFESKGNIWTDGVVYTDLLNTGNGQSFKMEELNFRTLPGDRRRLKIPIPKEMSKGNYTATAMMDFGNDSEMEAAELKFSYEP